MLRHNKTKKCREFAVLPKLRLGRATTLLTLGCFSLPLTSAHASGTGLPPVVVHPIQQVSIPTTHANGSNTANPTAPGSNNGSNQAGSGQGLKSNGNQPGTGTVSGTQGGNTASNKPGNQNVSPGSTSKNSPTNQNTVGQNGATQTSSAPVTSLPTAGYKLDLSSTTANIVLGSNLFNHSQSITINVGGSSQSFSSGQKVTAAEYMAIQQQLSGNGQSLVLDAQGAADAGKFTLNSIASQKVTELVVPQNVTGLDYFSKNPTISINGDLLNSGSIYGVSTSSAIKAGTINATDITNSSGGIISTTLPGSLASTIPSALSTLNLTLDAQNSITNAGTISSSGTLTLATAHGGINNIAAASASSQANAPALTPTPTIHAVNDLNLSAGNGLIVNAGLVTSDNGNINISAPNPNTTIAINAQGGTFQALNGNINVRTPSYSGGAGVSLSGGNYLSNDFNIYSGQGDVEGLVNHVSGNLNTLAQTEHFGTAGGNLLLGNNTVTGDPTYANEGGDVTLTGQSTFYENLVVIASGNIYANSTGQIIDQGPEGNNNVTLIAGAGVSILETPPSMYGGDNNPSGVTVVGSAQALVMNNTVTVNFAIGAGTGGNIDLRGSTANPVINTSGGPDVDGGNVILAAMESGNGLAGGRVLFNTGSTSIITAGYYDIHSQTNGGNISIYAGNNLSSTTVQTGNLVTCGVTGGNVTILTSIPTASGGLFAQQIVYGPMGMIWYGATIGPYSNFPTATSTVIVGEIDTYGSSGQGAVFGVSAAANGGLAGNILIHAGSNITTGNLYAYGGGGGGGATPLSVGAIGGEGGNVTITSDNGSITVNGAINTSGGGGGGTITVGSNGGSAGAVSVSAPNGPISIANGVYAVPGAGGGTSPGQQGFGSAGGGGGGGSFGGGGGGGAGGFTGGAGGGGGGVSGGGGGGGSNSEGNFSEGGYGGGWNGTVDTGGAGGLGTTGSGNGANGGTFVGGMGGASEGGLGGNGGVFGGGGGGGQGFPPVGSNGANVANAAGNGAAISMSYGTITAGNGLPLVLTANGSGAQNGGTISYVTTATTPLTVGTAAYNLQVAANGGATSGNAGSVTISTGGTLTVNANGLALTPLSGSGNGASITLNASNVIAGGGVPLALVASGAGSGNGGNITILSSGNASQTIGNVTGGFQLVAASGPAGTQGGTISFTTGGNLSVNPTQISVAALGTNATGGSITFSAGTSGPGTLVINGALNVSGTGTGSGGAIVLQSNSTQPFTVGGALSSNGISGALTAPGSASAIKIDNTGGGVETFELVSANSIQISANLGNLAIAAPITGTGSNSVVTLTAHNSILNSGSPPTITASDIILAPEVADGTAASPLYLNAGAVSLIGGGGYLVNFANGGQSIGIPFGLTGPLSYSGTGNITFTGTATVAGNITVVSGSFGSGDVQGNILFSEPIVATGGTSTISLTTGGANSFIESGAGNLQAANINLQTGSGAVGSSGTPFQLNAINLSVLTTGLVNITDANSVTLTGGSSQSSFTLSTPGNLTVGANILPAASSINLSTTSNNGNITINGSIGGAATASVTLSSEGSGEISGNGLVSGSSTSFTSSGGSIFLNVNTSNLTVNTSTNGQVGIANTSTLGGFTLSSSTAGTSFNVSYAGPGPWTVNDVVAPSGITLSGTGNLTIGALASDANITIQNALNGGNGNITINGGIVSLSSSSTVGIFTSGTGSIEETGGFSIAAHNVTLASSSGAIGSIASPLQLVASSLAANTTGLVEINDTQTAGVTLTSANTTSGFVLTSQGEITINGGLTSASAIGLFAQNSNGGILFNSSIGNAATSVSLGANGTGLIQQTNAQGYVVQGSSLNIAGASGGVYIGFNSNNITATGNGIVSLGDFSFAASTVNTSSAGTSFSLGANGSLILGSITANDGYLNILSAGSLLQVNSGATETATNGIILFRQADTTNGQIVVQGGSTTLQTAGLNGGAVELIVGVTVPPPVMGPSPSNVTVNQITSGNVYYGTNGISVPVAKATLNLEGNNIQFSTGALPASAIVLGPGVEITADPVGSVANSQPPSAAQATNAPAIYAGLSQNSVTPAILAPPTQISRPPAPITQTQAMMTPQIVPVQITADQTLASNLGLAGSSNSPPILAALASGTDSAPTAAANPSIALAGISALTTAAGSAPISIDASAASISDTNWMTKAAPVNGRIPAIIFSDAAFDIEPTTSMIVDLEENNSSPPSQIESSAADSHQFASKDTPLSGAISHTVSHERRLKLKNGSVVFAPSQRTIIETPFAEVKLEAKSVVLIMCSGLSLSVFDLDDSHGKSVVMDAGKRQFILSPGTHATITSEPVNSFDKINPLELIGYHSVQTHSLRDGLTAFVAEFSVPQAINAVDSLSKLVNSKHPQAQKIAAHILKTTAILSQMNPAEYRQFVKSDITAYLPEVNQK